MYGFINDPILQNMKQEYQDKIDSYLLSKMTKEESSAFETLLEQDAELKEQFHFTKSLKHAISSRNEKIKLIEDWEMQYLKKKESATKKFPKILSLKNAYWFSGIAAILIVGFFIFTNNDFVEESNGVILQNNIVVRSDANYDSIITELNNKEYSKALATIDYEEKKLKNDEMEVDNSAQIIDEEELLYKKEVLRLRKEELLWLKIQALLGLNKTEEAIKAINVLRHSEGMYKIQADSLYNSIKTK